MAQDLVDLKSEERRRQVTLLVLGGLLFVTTMPVVNQRALFSPLGDVPILGELSPVAYAMTVGGLPGGRSRLLGPRAAGRIPGGAPYAPPSAFAVRTPGPAGIDQSPPGQQPSPGSARDVGPQSQPRVPTDNPSPPPGEPQIGSPGPGPGPGLDAPPPGEPSPGAVGAVPEPATWLTMILGFGVVGGLLRRARRRSQAPAVSALSAG